jgi:phage-related protein
MASKPLVCLGSTRDDLKQFPTDARVRAGFELYRVQQGRAPHDWKPMASVGSGVVEIRVRMAREFRVLYVAKFAEAVYVLHAFEKKSQKTAQRDLGVAAERYRDLLRMRQRRQV